MSVLSNTTRLIRSPVVFRTLFCLSGNKNDRHLKCMAIPSHIESQNNNGYRSYPAHQKIKDDKNKHQHNKQIKDQKQRIIKLETDFNELFKACEGLVVVSEMIVGALEDNLAKTDNKQQDDDNKLNEHFAKVEKKLNKISDDINERSDKTYKRFNEMDKQLKQI
jgi:hypothetical protein